LPDSKIYLSLGGDQKCKPHWGREYKNLSGKRHLREFSVNMNYKETDQGELGSLYGHTQLVKDRFGMRIQISSI
jgi:hypothetical protein